MTGRIVVFGATGYTGELTARALVAAGATPVLAGRNGERLRRLADSLGGLQTAVADVGEPMTVRDLVEAGDVLVSTVGPFARWGEPAVSAAIDAGASYIDSTGEPPFIRDVFERYGPRAKKAGVGLVTAFGYDWVPGNVAGALALREAGASAVRVDLGYFNTGTGSMSGGTRASLAGVMGEPGFVFRDGELHTERGAARVRSFRVGSTLSPAASVGSSEHFTLPRLAPNLREVNTYLGWFGPLTRPLQVVSAGSSVLTSIPGVRAGLGALAAKVVKGSTGGPDAASRARGGALIIAAAYDGAGIELAQVTMSGVNGYDFTAGILAWGAQQAATRGLDGTGALGPVEAFGLDEIVEGCRVAGLERQA